MTYLLLGLLILAMVIFAAHGLQNANTKKLAGRLRSFAPWGMLVIAALLAMRGGLAIAIPLATFAAVMLMSSSSRSSRPIGPSGGDFGGQTSNITTDTLEMELDLETGQMRGRVLKGIFAGKRLETLSVQDLALLWQDVRADDAQSAQLIETYLDSVHPTWREDVEQGEREMRGPDGRMSQDEAREILGVREGATDDEIRKAHRELILKLHPDRGGSTYLASKINEAKDALLDSG